MNKWSIPILIIALLWLALNLYVYKHRHLQETKPTHEERVEVVEVGESKEKEVPEQQVLLGRPMGMGKASWYDRSVCGERIYGETCKTANGEIFNEEDYTVAHKTMPFGTRVQFGYGDRSIVCRVNDRGPFIVGREWDMSSACFESLAPLGKGVIEVSYKKL